MAMISLLPNLPKISFPLCPSTVDTGKLGISSYRISYFSVISFAKLPNPVPSMMAVSGLVCILFFKKDAVS